jgi:flagellar protein FliO/FliZ
MSIGASSIFSAVAALVGVLGLIWAAGRVARLGGMARRPTTGGAISVEDVLAIDARRRIHLIRCEERRVLVLTGGPQDVVVGWLDPRAPSA